MVTVKTKGTAKENLLSMATKYGPHVSQTFQLESDMPQGKKEGTDVGGHIV